MRRGYFYKTSSKTLAAIAMLLLFTTPLSAVFASTATPSQVDIVAEGSLELLNLHLNAGELSPDGDFVLVVGGDGFSSILDSKDPMGKNILNTDTTVELHDLSWHPLSQSAIIVGDNGTVLKYSREGSNITGLYDANLFAADIYAVDWRGSGQWAYLGGEAGSLYKYRAADGYIKIENNLSSDITSISCHQVYDYCMFTTLQDGFGLIDRDHQIHLFGHTQYTWLTSSCSLRGLDRCTFYGSNLAVAILDFSRIDASASQVIGSVTFLSTATSSEFVSASAHSNEKTMLHMAPYGMVEYNLEEMSAYPWLNNVDAADSSAQLSSTTPIVSWDIGQYEGWVVSSDGTIASYSQKYFEALSGWDEGPTILVMLVVIIVVPGSIMGLIFMFSDRAQQWWKDRAKAKRLRRIKESSNKGNKSKSNRKKSK